MRPTPDATARPIRFSARDGLQLLVRCYEAPGSTRPPVLCLAGLTRNSRDFHDIALDLSSGPAARTVWALDSRGRGHSDHDPKWENYNVLVEAQDVIDLAVMAGLHGATVIGTSRGGILAMIIAALQPTLLGAVVLNDIGPVIERDGLARIAGYVGRLPLPGSWKDAAALIADISKRHFTNVPPEHWEEAARAWFNEKDGRPAPGYDPAIAKSVTAHASAIPQLWPQFLALSKLPTLVVRGEHSDILSARTVTEMLQKHPNIAAITVAGHGHAPLLKDQLSIGTVARFIAAAENHEPVAGRDFAAEG
jgi:pimeloyl-ACP methyl ester carboxylesterase